MPRILVATHPDIRIAPGRFQLQTDLQGRPIAGLPIAHVRPNTKPSPTAFQAKKSGLRPLAGLVLVLAGITFSASVWWAYQEHRMFQRVERRMATEIAALREELAEIQRKYDEEASRREAIEIALGETLVNLKNTRGEIDALLAKAAEYRHNIAEYDRIAEQLGVSGPKGVRAKLRLPAPSRTDTNATQAFGERGRPNSRQVLKPVD